VLGERENLGALVRVEMAEGEGLINARVACLAPGESHPFDVEPELRGSPAGGFDLPDTGAAGLLLRRVYRIRDFAKDLGQEGEVEAQGEEG
jgi:hypothetical protein